jgi:chorismate mutase / prephenate dehydratase
MTLKSSIAFLGPEGTFAHMAAKLRFGTKGRFVPLPSVKHVFEYVSQEHSRLGIVPIENSSGGTIYDTVDRLVDESCDLHIQESLSINVKLALLGRNTKNIRVIYSHFAPLQHCEDWLDDNFPQAELREEPSTATAVKKAAEQAGAAAIASRLAGEKYNLKVLAYPIESEVQNVTQFFVLGHNTIAPKDSSRTTMLVSLANRPGSLCEFLTPFKAEGVNLSRIVSRAIVGQPSKYVFLLDIEGTPRQNHVNLALRQAKSTGSQVKIIGAYPVREPYES